jgi:dTDP-4-amino-4,6-dideoxygalactose transaminase
MQFVDLVTQQQRIREKLETNIKAVLNHGKYIMGPEIQMLEKQLSGYVGTRHAISCASGTDALLLALMAYGVGPGDAIFTSPFTFIATAEVISLLGAVPVFVDIDARTFNMVPEKLEQAIASFDNQNLSHYPLPRFTKQEPTSIIPRGVITVDIFGLPCDYDQVNTIARDHNLFVIEDAAQSFGATYKNRMSCSLADVGCTSFFPAKPLGCYGDGGAIFTDNDDIAKKIVSMRVHGQGSHKYDNIRIGLNARMDTLQAAILLAKLDIFPEEIQLRQQVSKRYTDLMSNNSFLTMPHVPESYQSAWAQFSILAKDETHRSKGQAHLEKSGIPTAIYYAKPLHLQSAFAYLGYKEGDYPVSEDCAQRIFSLPMHPYLTMDEQGRVAQTLSEI